MEQTALANRLCHPSLLHLEPVAPSHQPPPNVQTQPVGAQEPLDEGILLVRDFRRRDSEPVTIPDELPERVFSKWREISHGFGL